MAKSEVPDVKVPGFFFFLMLLSVRRDQKDDISRKGEPRTATSTFTQLMSSER